jgi:hypothetical protein
MEGRPGTLKRSCNWVEKGSALVVNNDIQKIRKMKSRERAAPLN